MKNTKLSTYYVEGIEVNILYKYQDNIRPSFTLNKFIWVNNLPDNYVLLNEGDEILGTTTYALTREDDKLFPLNLMSGKWDVSFYPMVEINPEMEFIQ